MVSWRMTVSVRKPSDEALRRFVATQAERPFSYSEVGATAATAPAGFVLDHRRTRLGAGENVFAAARAALQRWEQFRLGWVDVWLADPTIQTGAVAAVMGRSVGLWWLNACRIVYTVDEAGPVARFGFAYGTLPGHVESGEERFLVEWDRATDSVWYDLRAFSRPDLLLTRLAYPMIRRQQLRFQRESAAAMLRAVTGGGTTPGTIICNTTTYGATSATALNLKDEHSHESISQ